MLHLFPEEVTEASLLPQQGFMSPMVPADDQALTEQ